MTSTLNWLGFFLFWSVFALGLFWIIRRISGRPAPDEPVDDNGADSPTEPAKWMKPPFVNEGEIDVDSEEERRERRKKMQPL